MKLGKTAAKHTMKSMRSAIALALAFNELPPPPDSSEPWVDAILKQAPSLPNYNSLNPLDVACNDKWGCCVISDIDHQGMLWSANTGTIVKMSDADILALYQILCPGFDPTQTDAYGNNPTDQGCNEQDACDYLIKQGLLAASASIDPANTIHQRWAIQLYGSIKFGIRLPDFAEDLFNQGKVWDVPNNGKPLKFIGGHDVCGIGYQKDGNTWLYQICTWGRVQLATPAFMAATMDEVHCPLSNTWAKQTGLAPSGYDFAALESALSQAIKI